MASRGILQAAGLACSATSSGFLRRLGHTPRGLCQGSVTLFSNIPPSSSPQDPNATQQPQEPNSLSSSSPTKQQTLASSASISSSAASGTTGKERREKPDNQNPQQDDEDPWGPLPQSDPEVAKLHAPNIFFVTGGAALGAVLAVSVAGLGIYGCFYLSLLLLSSSKGFKGPLSKEHENKDSKGGSAATAMTSTTATASSSKDEKPVAAPAIVAVVEAPPAATAAGPADTPAPAADVAVKAEGSEGPAAPAAKWYWGLAWVGRAAGGAWRWLVPGRRAAKTAAGAAAATEESVDSKGPEPVAA